ncbi:MAG: hypothetical protein AAB352_03915 [Patescibacteria group bacterium]
MEQEKVLSLSFPISLNAVASSLVFTGLSVLSIVGPFLLGHPQWLVGTAVNACLFLAVVFLPSKYYLPLAIFPSLGVLSRGIIFGPLTPFLIYFMPFIWIGNLVLIIAFKKAFDCVGNNNIIFIAGVLGSSALKFLFLLSAANVYFKFNIVPAVFLQIMGFNQLATALAGGLISFLIFKIYGQYIKRGGRTA